MSDWVIRKFGNMGGMLIVVIINKSNYSAQSLEGTKRHKEKV